MSDIVAKIQEKKKLNANDRIILQYIVDHLDEIPRISSRELARRTYTTSSSVSRLVKKLDFANYNDFKLNVSSYLKNLDYQNETPQAQDDLLTLLNKVSGMEMNVITQTKANLSMETLQRASDLLKAATYIDIVATDTNGAMADYLCHMLWGLGKIVHVYKEEDIQLYFSLHVPKDHLVMVISRFAFSQNIKRVVTNLAASQIPMIAFTIKEDSFLTRYATCVFYAYYEESSENLSKLVFYISLKFIFDLVCVILFSHDYEEREKLGEILKAYYQ
ncbi:MAG TPA: MurR/RpiR family transcriptional regulator [Candidatus Fimiplasma intestinipullorum]|uniref:MurR/RpiR family transcriptional regulator n=1 Tax=Candidatus Fimiplasma intestinipullorum TaxID=2840825 RepID=A0A9D1HMP9_9FIRM|nr:MurR/RpiR family transcriptional regulator [Candidatus Fimiplasma intestinipullorum]